MSSFIINAGCNASGMAAAPFASGHCLDFVGLGVVGLALLLIDPGCIGLCFLELAARRDSFNPVLP